MLRPGGTLLLGVPTNAEDDVYFPQHRLYGPVRLPQLLKLRGFHLLGRVWNNHTVVGGLERADEPPKLYRQRYCRRRHAAGNLTRRWPLCDAEYDGPGLIQDAQHQQVFVCRALSTSPDT